MEKIIMAKNDLKKRGYKGFTLMEMLIVVAIIAVLVAIAIPVFSAQLNNAKVAADAANIRGGYAAATADVAGNKDAASGDTYYLKKDGTVTQTQSEGDFKTQGTASDAQDVAGQDLTWGADKSVTYTYNGSSITITIG
ncbi:MULTISPECIES: competence type IV pilus major pilin ComGC [Atopobiaceae]|uniref:Type IV pilus assembly protein PilA n=1 Tax=Parafannyhessea umbonata TaxID=604330 RepID=A0A1H6HZA5_9ACTN|nr:MULTISPECIES: prepilin-type N-terminal cleavage/methylation domain-containing protein [Atopobiaceae]SEH41663.1 type IV pilus assembly protein PilA [Parafannyhessea umbonata]